MDIEVYSLKDIGQDDGQSIVEIKQVKVVCNKCGATYEDEESVDMVKKWIRAGYAPCPNISCPGELEIKEATQ